MGILDKFGEWYGKQTGAGTATNLTALKVNIEKALDALKCLDELADEMEDALSKNGSKSKCYNSIRAGIDGEAKTILLEYLNEWTSDQLNECERIHSQVKRIRNQINHLRETDLALAKQIENS